MWQLNIHKGDNFKGAYWLLIDGTRTNFVGMDISVWDKGNLYSSLSINMINVRLTAGQQIQLENYDSRFTTTSIFGVNEENGWVYSFCSGTMLYPFDETE